MSAFSFVPDGTFMVRLTGSPSAKALGYFQIKLGCCALASVLTFLDFKSVCSALWVLASNPFMVKVCVSIIVSMGQISAL
jgi:hypothetical protein